MPLPAATCGIGTMSVTQSCKSVSVFAGRSVGLDSYKDHLIGVNLHDLKDLDEYHPPSFGDVDFGDVFTELPADVLKVLEVRHGTSEELTEAKEFVSGNT